MRRFLALALLLILPLTFIGGALAAEEPDWGVKRIRANLVWVINTGGEVKIAILDSGLWEFHEDLDGTKIDGRSWAFPDPWYDDIKNHGTLVAGVIAAIINDYGLIGVSPTVSLYAAKVDPPQYLPQDIVEALYWVADPNGVDADIIVMIFTLPHYQEIQDACDDLYWNKNKLLIASAGNDNGPVSYPARYESVIAVGAVDANDNRWVEPPY
jgi:subtilisin